MFRTWALFPKTAESRFDRDYFLNEHIARVKALLGPHGLLDINIEEGALLEPPGPETAYVMMSCLTFETLEALETAMRACGRELSAEFADFTDVRPTIQVNRVVR